MGSTSTTNTERLASTGQILSKSDTAGKRLSVGNSDSKLQNGTLRSVPTTSVAAQYQKSFSDSAAIARPNKQHRGSVNQAVQAPEMANLSSEDSPPDSISSTEHEICEIVDETIEQRLHLPRQERSHQAKKFYDTPTSSIDAEDAEDAEDAKYAKDAKDAEVAENKRFSDWIKQARDFTIRTNTETLNIYSLLATCVHTIEDILKDANLSEQQKETFSAVPTCVQTDLDNLLQYFNQENLQNLNKSRIDLSDLTSNNGLGQPNYNISELQLDRLRRDIDNIQSNISELLSNTELLSAHDDAVLNRPSTLVKTSDKSRLAQQPANEADLAILSEKFSPETTPEEVAESIHAFIANEL